MLRQLAILLTIHLAVSHAFTIQPKILNGVLGNTTNYPFFAKISGERTECSASLISDSWVITASHCVERLIPLHVSLGIRQDGTYESTVEVSVADQFMYPGFLKHKVYDIALVKLSPPIQFSQSIQPVQLPQNCEELEEGEVVDGVGIGFYRQSSLGPKIDGKLRVGHFNTTGCNACESLRKNVPDTQSIICTAHSFEQTMAGGDSGCPLIRQKDGVQVGVHKGNYRAIDTCLGIFPRISHYFNWMAFVTGMNLPLCMIQAPVLVN